MGCCRYCAFSTKTKHPVLTRPISNPHTLISYPRLLEPRFPTLLPRLRGMDRAKAIPALFWISFGLWMLISIIVLVVGGLVSGDWEKARPNPLALGGAHS